MNNTIPRRKALSIIGAGLAGIWTAVFTGLSGVFVLNPLRGGGGAQTINLGDMWSYGEVFRLVKHERLLAKEKRVAEVFRSRRWSP